MLGLRKLIGMSLMLVGCAAQTTEPAAPSGTGGFTAESLLGEWAGEWGVPAYRDAAYMTITRVVGNRIEGTMRLNASSSHPGYNRDYPFVATLAGNTLTIPGWSHWSPLVIDKDGVTMHGAFVGEVRYSVSLRMVKRRGGGKGY